MAWSTVVENKDARVDSLFQRSDCGRRLGLQKLWKAEAQQAQATNLNGVAASNFFFQVMHAASIPEVASVLQVMLTTPSFCTRLSERIGVK